MSSYLTVAEEALRIARRPLTSREIVEVAYRNELVPPNLFGKTQHKTVGARLSENILSSRDKSRFYRSEPGRFFLREFLHDETMPKAFRSPIIARRRERELRRGATLTVDRTTAEAALSSTEAPSATLASLSAQNSFRYSSNDRSTKSETDLSVWSFVTFRRGREVLTYRHGRYREGRDSFLQRRSIGFFTPVADRDADLFDEGDRGIIASGLRAIAFDLDLPHIVFDPRYQSNVIISDIFVAADDRQRFDLLAVVTLECPPGFEPLTRRLAINDLDWLCLDRPINHIEDFDPWSQAVVARWTERRKIPAHLF